MIRRLILLSVLISVPAQALAADEEDSWLWLEEQNTRTLGELEATPGFKTIMKRSLEIYDSDARIPAPGLRGDQVYNFWQDPDHERGIWRRTSLASYRQEEPEWETVLDLDALSEKEGKPWVFKSARCLPPEYRRCILSLSRGGSDATFIREFDAVTKSFVVDGFSLQEAKTFTNWKDIDTLWVATDFGEGSLTSSGYPRIVKEWKRGQSISEARTVFQGETDDVGTFSTILHNLDGRYHLIFRNPTFFTSEVYIVLGERIVRLNIPDDADFQGIFRDHVLFTLRTDWTVGETTHRQGSLLAGDLDDLLRSRMVFDTLFEPGDKISLDGVSTTGQELLLTTLDNVRGRLFRLVPDVDGWKRSEVELPGIGAVSIKATSDQGGTYMYMYEDFLTPPSLFVSEDGKTAGIKSQPAFFDTTGMKIVQHEAKSKDGTLIPYFMVTPKGFEPNGKAPTLLYGYGGFAVSMTPTYANIAGPNWLERGGVYVVANIRGGGEFGPRWHLAAQKENRIKSFEDFIAVAEDLVARKITSPRHLGIMGGSQGGLLVGGALTLRPDLFQAVVCQVPLLDMKRYHTLLAGASWMAEYGNPEIPEEWGYIKEWSPYHNLDKDRKYPRAFFWTSHRDDRVHPAHARKMAARMLDMGNPVYYYENLEGGHGLGSVNSQRAHIRALEYSYLWKMLK